MLRELKYAVRSLQKDLYYYLLNLFGLTIGISFSFLIFIYVNHELSYDNHIENATNIYRVSSNFTINGHSDIYSNTPRPMGQALVQEYPDIIQSTKFMGFGGLSDHSGFVKKSEADEAIRSKHLFVADSNFFKVFNLPFKHGGREALHTANTAVISESFAKKLFGKTDIIGEHFLLNEKTIHITGVLKDYKHPTYLPMEIIISYNTYSSPNSEIWWYGGHVFTYVKTTPDFDPKNVYENWEPFFNKYMKSTFDKLGGEASIIFQPLRDIYLSPEFIWEPYPHNTWRNIQVFSVIGFFLLIVAGFNYINLSISQSSYQFKNVGVKKMLGSGKTLLIRQHLTQSIMLFTLAGGLSVSLISTLLPIFNQLQRSITSTNYSITPELLAIILIASIFCGFLSGIYPAFYEASFSPGDIKSAPKTNQIISTRKFFVTGQLTISIALVICTLVVIDQIHYLKSRDVGFNNENLVFIPLKDPAIRANVEPLKIGLRKLAGVKDVSMTEGTPGTGSDEFTFWFQHPSGDFVSTPSQTMGVGLNFISTMQLNILAGRAFQKQDDQYSGVIVNEFLAAKMGYSPTDAIGVKIKFGNEENSDRKIIGVVNNFHMGSAKEGMEAMTLGLRLASKRFFLIRIDSKNPQVTLDRIKALWAEYGSDFPFAYSFMKDELNDLLNNEEMLFDLLIIGSILIIFISCLGLVGLSSHSVAKRTKEIGIRKVVGASRQSLFFTIIKEFLPTFIISFTLGSSIAWFASNEWLNGFAYRAGFEISNIIISGVLVSFIILITISYHTLKVVNCDPVESLRYE